MRETGILDEALPTRDERERPRPEGAAAARRLALGFSLLLALTFGLIVLGALVRAYGAGLACPDWPLCFGQLVPEMDLQVAFEWTHRAVAGGVALLFCALAVATWRRVPDARETRRLLIGAALLLAAQVLLGALTVWKLLAAWTVTAHLLTGNAFAATLLLVARSLRERAGGAHRVAPATGRARAWLLAAAALLLAQMLLGGLVSSRYAGMACPEWPTCSGGVWFPSWRGTVGLHVLHRLFGYAFALTLIGAAVSSRRERRLRPLAALACGLALAQVAVGVANVTLGLPVEVTGLHSALAAALVLTLTLAVREALRRTVPARPSGGPGPG